ncbi:MAG: hypothetical protein JNK45_20415 [Myxococcales bacterium]|jgi:hypothetical protein|nr:hypothetical protein [Myxococcales bacterium]
MTKPSLTVVTLLALLGTGCAENEESLIVLNAPAWTEDGCVITADPSAVGLLFGLLDLSYGTSYVMPVILLNNTEPRDTANAGIDTNEMQLLSVDVDLSMSQAPDVMDAVRDVDEGLVSFNLPLATNSLPAGATQGVAVEAISQRASNALAQAIVAQLGADARPTVEATVVFHASRSGNGVGKVGEIDSRDFTFPIRVCVGCLTSYATCPGGVEPEPEPGVEVEWAGGICGNAQDNVVYPSVCEPPAE